MRKTPVIITRPQAQSEAFARMIASIGRESKIFPLMEIHALLDNTELDAILAQLSDFALVAFVSPNAVDAVFLRIKHWPSDVAIAVMGAGSRAALAAHGITDANTCIISPTNPERTDSETLLEELDLDGLRASRMLIVRGETGRELLADALRENSVFVTQVAAYRRAAPEFTQQRQQCLFELLLSENEWVITSSDALRTMLFWAEQLNFDGAVVKMQHQQLIVPHVRIAETAKILGFQSITLTGSGDERLLVALQSHL